MDIQRISEDNPEKTLFSAWVMLIEWRNGHIGDVTTQKKDLRKALIEHGKMNIVDLL